jgi:hypothetical protein
MTRIPLNYGSSAGDASADFLFDIFGDVEANTVELYKAVRRHPGWRPGTYYGPPGLATGTVTVTASNRIYAAPFEIKTAVTIASLFGLTISHLAGNAKFALYTNDYADGLPDARIDSVAAAASTANNTIIGPTALSGGNLTLDPGIYWFASMYDAAIGMHGYNAGDKYVGSLIGGNNAPRALGAASSGISGVYADSTGIYTSGFPSTFPAPTINFTGGTPYGGWVTA